MQTRFFLVLIIFFTTVSVQAQYHVLRWYQGKAFAVSVCFDENDESQFTKALPILNEKKIKASFYINGGTVDWDLLKNAAKTGHEIGNATLSNTDLAKVSRSKIEKEVTDNHVLFKAKFPKQMKLTFAYPNSSGMGFNPKEDTIRKVVERYYLAARGLGPSGGYIGERLYDKHDENTKPEYKNYFFQIGAYPISANVTKDDFEKLLDISRDNYGWFKPVYKAIGDGEGKVSEENFKAHMDLLARNNDDIWIAPFADVVRYMKQRQSVKIKEVSLNEKQWILKMTDDLTKEDVYNLPMTFQIIKPFEGYVKKIKQNKKKITYVEDYKLLQIDAVPDGGDIIIYRKKVKK